MRLDVAVLLLLERFADRSGKIDVNAPTLLHFAGWESQVFHKLVLF
jgi:hypothetical protein